MAIFAPFGEYKLLLVNPVVWAILFTAMVCYALLIELTVIRQKSDLWFIEVQEWNVPLRILLSALPLLGLLGTISGLLKTFLSMGESGAVALQEVISGGIADAMFTTQLGLVLVVPGLLFYRYLLAQKAQWEVNQSK